MIKIATANISALNVIPNDITAKYEIKPANISSNILNIIELFESISGTIAETVAIVTNDITFFINSTSILGFTT